jgi:hypothetical protein
MLVVSVLVAEVADRPSSAATSTPDNMHDDHAQQQEELCSARRHACDSASRARSNAFRPTHVAVTSLGESSRH